MSDNMENRRQTRRLSSILKNVAAVGDSPTQTFNRRSKRISFSHVNNVKEFVADGNNQTIWGNSYEKSHTAADGSNSGSVSQTPTIDSVAPMSSMVEFVAPAAVIDLFADIEDGADGDVEMEVTDDNSRSPTRLFNQTLFVEETLTDSVTTSMTNCQTVDMSTTTATNKRKTIETITEDKVTETMSKSVKIRRMNDENLEPNAHNTILQRVSMDVTVSDRKSVATSHMNLHSTRIFDDAADLSDNVVVPQSEIPENPLNHSPHIGSSQMLDKTSIAATDMTIDDHSITSSTSHPASEPISNRTQIYSDGIDQTFAVRNPLLENNASGWSAIERLDDSDKHTTQGGEVADSQRFEDNESRPRLDDLTVSMDFEFKNHSLLSNHSLNADEPILEDLTIMMDTNFKAEVSEESDDFELHSTTKNHSQQPKTPANHTGLSMAENRESASRNGSVCPPLERQNANDFTSKAYTDMTLCSVVSDVGTACRQKVSSPAFDIRFDGTNQNLPKGEFFDCSATQDRVVANDFSFGNADPLSSTRFVAPNRLNFSDTNNKANSSSITFNYNCPAITTQQSHDRRSVASLQNNTDELCNLEPDQLKRRSELKKLFLSLSEGSNDMLSETKMDLVNISAESKESSIGPTSQLPKLQLFPESRPECASNQDEKPSDVADRSNDILEPKPETQIEQRCQKCSNCRRSMDGNQQTFLQKSQHSPPKLDFSVYDQFKGLATLRDVVEARKKREAARKLEEELLVDQNVEAPDVRLLWLNMRANENSAEPRPAYVPEPITCFPLRMNIKYLMKNKMNTEYGQWKYNDNFFLIGALALRHDAIPSIRIHIKFDCNAPAKAEELNMQLLFSRVFIEECPTYLRRISAANFLKHKNALALLPVNLLSILSDSENIYRGLEQIEKSFQTVVAKVNEIDALSSQHDAFLKLEYGQCCIERTVFDVQSHQMQDIRITLDRIDAVGPKCVCFVPPCETTDEFKALPSGLAFLRLFLADPKSYLLPSIE